MRTSFTVTVKRQLSMLAFPIFRVLVATGIFFYVGLGISYIFFLIAGFLFIIDYLPVIIFHVQYFLINRRSELTIDTGNRCISRKVSGDVKAYSFDKIVSLTYVASSAGKGAPGWYSWGHYSYCVIQFSDGKQFFVTCLMDDLQPTTLETLLKVRAENDWPVFPFIWGRHP